MISRRVALALILLAPIVPEVADSGSARPRPAVVTVPEDVPFDLETATVSSRSAAEVAAERQAREAAARASALRSRGLTVSPDGTTVVPVARYRVTSRYGYRTVPWSGLHAGVDLAAPVGTPVHAVADGVVVAARGADSGAMDPDYWVSGYVVAIDHGTAVTTYNHLVTPTTVSLGQEVRAGDVIGHVGLSGHTTGPHLHFQVLTGGERVDPDPWMAARGAGI